MQVDKPLQLVAPHIDWAAGIITFAPAERMQIMDRKRDFIIRPGLPDGDTICVLGKLGPELRSTWKIVERFLWFYLPVLYRRSKDKFRRRNHGHVEISYWSLVRKCLILPKYPVVHPHWKDRS